MSIPRSTFTGRRKPLAPFSRKKLATLAAHEAFVARILEERKWCEAPARLAVLDEYPPVVVQPRCRVVSTEVHHVLQRSLCGKDDDANVLALCRACHAWIDNNIEAAHTVGLLRHSWETT